MFSKKRHFSKKMIFFQFFIYLIPGLWVPMRPTRHCGRVGTHNGGVQSVFRCPRANLKKKRPNLAVFKFCFFAKNAPKCAKIFFCVSGPLGNVKPILTSNFSSFGLQTKPAITFDHFWGVKWTFPITFYFFYFLCYLKAQ